MDDICAGRHRGNPRSETANLRAAAYKAAQRAAVLALIKDNPHSMKEVAQLMGVPFNTVSGRGSELKRDGLVSPTGEVRDGSAVLRAIE